MNCNFRLVWKINGGTERYHDFHAASVELAKERVPIILKAHHYRARFQSNAVMGVELFQSVKTVDVDEFRRLVEISTE